MIEEKAGTTEKRLTPAEWLEAATIYELGEASMVELSKRFGVSVSAISQHFRKNGVEKGSKKKEVASAVAEKVVEKVSVEASGFAIERKKRIEETKIQSYQSMQAIHLLTHKAITDAAKTKDGIASAYGHIKTLRLAAATIAQTREERYILLDALEELDEFQIPVLTIDDLSQEMIDDLQRQHDDNPDDMIVGAEDDDEIVETS